MLGLTNAMNLFTVALAFRFDVVTPPYPDRSVPIGVMLVATAFGTAVHCVLIGHVIRKSQHEVKSASHDIRWDIRNVWIYVGASVIAMILAALWRARPA